MEIRASFHAATLNLATNVAKSDEDSIGSGGVDKVIRQVQVCVITKKNLHLCDLLFRGSQNSVIRYIGRVGYALNVNEHI